MASVRLTLHTIAGGLLAEGFEDALQRVNASFEDRDLDDADREITIKIKLRREGEGYVKTTHHVETKLPAKKVTGMSWVREDGLYTESLCVGGEKDPRQMHLPAVEYDGKVTPLGRRSKRED